MERRDPNGSGYGAPPASARPAVRAAAMGPERSFPAAPSPDRARAAREPVGIYAARLAFWGVWQFLLHFTEQVGELLAPLFFVAGLGWGVIVHVVGSLSLDDAGWPKIAEKLPRELWVDGFYLTPVRLVFDGLLLMALVAACRTALALINKET